MYTIRWDKSLKDEIHLDTDLGGNIKEIVNSNAEVNNSFVCNGSVKTDYFVCSLPIVSEKFKLFLDEEINKGELNFYPIDLSINGKIDIYYIMKVNTVVDGIDSSESEIEIFENKIYEINKLRVLPEIDDNIFILKRLNGFIWINDELKNKIIDLKITGIKFLDIKDFEFPLIEF